jgi:RNA polymerase sigma-70 factor, ECF subfamily
VTEENLIRGLQAGEEDAFRLLTDTWQKQVFNTCYSIVHNREDADDLTQDVFIEVFRSAGKFRGDARLSTWLYRMAVNKSLNLIRSRKNRRWLRFFEDQPSVGEAATRISSGKLASDDLEQEQLSGRLHQAIDSLAENQRIAFLLNKYEELPYQQIAEVMGTSLSAVESLIHRAKNNLQKKLWEAYKKNSL